MQRNSDADRIIRKVPWAHPNHDWDEDFYYDRRRIMTPSCSTFWRATSPTASGQRASHALEGIGNAISGNRVSSLSAAYTLLALDAYAKAAAPKVKLAVVLNGQKRSPAPPR